MYRHSDHSDSNAPSRTAITGQQDKLPREGMISKNITRNIPRNNRNPSTREIPTVAHSGSQTRPIPRVPSKQTFNSNTRVIPSNCGYNSATHKTANNSHRPSNPQSMSQTQRIPNGNRNTGVGNGATRPNGVTAARGNSRKIPTKILILRFIKKYRSIVAVGLACLLFLSISVPLMAFALTDVTDKTTDVDSTYEAYLENDTGKEDKDPTETNNSNGVSGDSSNDASGSKSPEEDDTDKLPAEDATDESTSEDTETNERAESEDSVETEDENAGKFAVTIYFYDREAITCYTKPATLRQILANAGCVLKDSDRPTVDLDQMIEYESGIMIDSVSYKQVIDSEPIPFETETYESDTVPRGTVKTVSWGVNGSKEKVYTVEYVNGKEVNRTFEYEYIASYPSNQINYYGIGGTFTASDGTVYSYSYRVEVRATYYNIYGTTATGLPTGHNIVAVDPNVFPLGTEMYVMGGSYDMGYRIAADTGGAVKGNLIDLWMDETNPDYFRFAHQGVVNMTAYVLG